MHHTLLVHLAHYLTLATHCLRLALTTPQVTISPWPIHSRLKQRHYPPPTSNLNRNLERWKQVHAVQQHQEYRLAVTKSLVACFSPVHTLLLPLNAALLVAPFCSIHTIPPLPQPLLWQHGLRSVQLLPSSSSSILRPAPAGSGAKTERRLSSATSIRQLRPALRSRLRKLCPATRWIRRLRI